MLKIVIFTKDVIVKMYEDSDYHAHLSYAKYR